MTDLFRAQEKTFFEFDSARNCHVQCSINRNSASVWTSSDRYISINVMMLHYKARKNEAKLSFSTSGGDGMTRQAAPSVVAL